MNTEGVFRTAARQFAEKDNAVIYFAHRDIVVLDAWETLFHVIQLVIVGGKESAGVHFRPFVKMFDDAPSDGDAVVGRGAASQFVEEHQTALRDVVHDVRRLAHFDHEGTFAHRDIVRSPHTRENLVDDSHTCRVGRDERTDLRHQCDERCLAQQRTLTRHIRAGDDDDLLLLGVEQDIVRHIFFARRHEGFDHGVASGLDVEHFALVHHRTHVALRHGQAGKGVIDVQLGQSLCIALECHDVFGGRCHEFAVESRLEHQNLVFRAENFFLVFLQFLRDVAFRIDERLFANPLRRYELLIRVAYLHIVAEHVVESDLQTLNAGACDLAFLDLEQIVLARGLDVAQFVELRVHPVGNHLSFVHRQRRIVAQFALDALAQGGASVQLFADVANTLLRRLLTSVFQHHHRLQCAAQLLHLARVDATRRHLRHDAFQVAHLAELHFAEFAEFRFAEKVLHAVQSALDVLHRPQREEHPTSHQARPHGRKRAVEHGEQRSAVAVVGRNQFEIANRELVESHIALFLNAGDAGDVLNVVVLRLLEISENRPRRRGGCVEMIDAEAFEVLHVEVLEHLGARRSF